MILNWTCKTFYELSLEELYTILRLRNEVFVVEQNCPYQDLDYKDQQSLHLGGWDGTNLVAYTRLLPPGLSFKEASIGRVVTSPSYRATGAGRELMTRSIETAFTKFGCSSIRIGAQVYLTKFYQSLGFEPASAEYLEDNIPHIEMLLKKI